MSRFETFVIRASGLAIDTVFGVMEIGFRIRDAFNSLRGKA